MRPLILIAISMALTGCKQTPTTIAATANDLAGVYIGQPLPEGFTPREGDGHQLVFGHPTNLHIAGSEWARIIVLQDDRVIKVLLWRWADAVENDEATYEAFNHIVGALNDKLSPVVGWGEDHDRREKSSSRNPGEACKYDQYSSLKFWKMPNGDLYTLQLKADGRFGCEVSINLEGKDFVPTSF